MGLRLMIILGMLICLAACADKSRVREGLYRGIYEGATQMQELHNPDPTPPPRKEALSYDQYKREREQLLGGGDK